MSAAARMAPEERPYLSPVSEVASAVATTPADVRRWRVNEAENRAVSLFEKQCRMQRTLARGHHDYALCGRLIMRALDRALDVAAGCSCAPVHLEVGAYDAGCHVHDQGVGR